MPPIRLGKLGIIANNPVGSVNRTGLCITNMKRLPDWRIAALLLCKLPCRAWKKGSGWVPFRVRGLLARVRMLMRRYFSGFIGLVKTRRKPLAPASKPEESFNSSIKSP